MSPTSDAAQRVLLADCRLIDGAGNPWVAADVALDEGRVAAVGPAGSLSGGRAGWRVVDVGGRYVTPGFIDPHTHSDLTVLTDPGAESVVYQGVTTHVVGNCGMSAAPVDETRLADFVTMWESYFAVPRVTWRSFAEYLDTIAAGGCAINVAALVGHGALRIAAMGFDERAAGERELAVMKTPAGRGHDRRRLRSVGGPRLPARLLLVDRRARRARPGRQALRRSLRHATCAASARRSWRRSKRP